MIKITAEFIACEPVESSTESQQLSSLFDEANELVTLKVIYTSSLKSLGEKSTLLDPGDVVFVRREFLNDQEKFSITIDGKKVIRVPCHEVFAVKQNQYQTT